MIINMNRKFITYYKFDKFDNVVHTYFFFFFVLAYLTLRHIINTYDIVVVFLQWFVKHQANHLVLGVVSCLINMQLQHFGKLFVLKTSFPE